MHVSHPTETLPLRAHARLSSLLIVLASMGCSSSSTEIERSSNGGASGGAMGQGGSGESPPGGVAGRGDNLTRLGDCTKNEDCSEGELCSSSGLCVAPGECSVPGDCGPEQTCSGAGRCIDTGSCLVDSDCDAGFRCEASTAQCVPGSACGDQTIAVENVSPNLLVLLDRSCSMLENLKGEVVRAGPNKWTSAVTAVTRMTMQFASSLRFGLMMFPDTKGPVCSQEASPQVEIGPGNEQAIATLLAAALDEGDENFPDMPCTTPIDDAVRAASVLPELRTEERASYVVLVTDGKQSDCSVAGGDAGTLAIVKDLQREGISTFVVGFGERVDKRQLNLLAEAGGRPRPPGSNRFYSAGSQAELSTALAEIATRAQSCSFSLETPPTSSEKLFIFLDGTVLAPDDNGFRYVESSRTVQLLGEACAALQDGADHQLQAVSACSETPPMAPR